MAGLRRVAVERTLDDLVDPERLRCRLLGAFADGRLDLHFEAADCPADFVQRLPQTRPGVEHEAEEAVLVFELAGADIAEDRADLLRGHVRKIVVVCPVGGRDRPHDPLALVDSHAPSYLFIVDMARLDFRAR